MCPYKLSVQFSFSQEKCRSLIVSRSWAQQKGPVDDAYDLIDICGQAYNKSSDDNFSLSDSSLCMSDSEVMLLTKMGLANRPLTRTPCNKTMTINLAWKSVNCITTEAHLRPIKIFFGIRYIVLNSL